MILHGHGIRIRTVVVLPATADERAEVGECWQRRYRCTACGTILVVLPAGVMPRYLYSAGAIVVAFLLVEAEPVGRGLAHFDAYQRQGMYVRLSAGALAEPCYRWRSLDRWSDRAPLWWPAWPGSVASLLVAFVQQAGRDDLEAVVRVAVSGHVGWEGAT